MLVGIFTYQTGHRKTLEITLKLLGKGHRVTWFAFPFVKRPPKDDGRYPDRPPQLIDFNGPAFCARYGVRYREVAGWSDDHANELDADIFLHCTAKIVPASFIAGRTILNCHPGILPYNRGVDAFKWSILRGGPVGVTLHVIDAEIDRGHILARQTVPVLETDTLADLCRRAYAVECDLLANFDVHLYMTGCAEPVGDKYPVSHRCITKDVDDILEDVFLQQRDKLVAASGAVLDCAA